MSAPRFDDAFDANDHHQAFLQHPYPERQHRAPHLSTKLIKQLR